MYAVVQIFILTWNFLKQQYVYLPLSKIMHGGFKMAGEQADKNWKNSNQRNILAATDIVFVKREVYSIPFRSCFTLFL